MHSSIFHEVQFSGMLFHFLTFPVSSYDGSHTYKLKAWWGYIGIDSSKNNDIFNFDLQLVKSYFSSGEFYHTVFHSRGARPWLCIRIPARLFKHTDAQGLAARNFESVANICIFKSSTGNFDGQPALRTAVLQYVLELFFLGNRV